MSFSSRNIVVGRDETENVDGSNKEQRQKEFNPSVNNMTQVDPQQSSPLFRLPQELRDEIYEYLFTSTTIEYERNLMKDPGTRKLLGSNSLEVTRACRRAKQDVGHTWLRLVLFKFDSPKAMLDVLAMLPFEICSKIRRVSVDDTPLWVGRKDGGGITSYSLHQALKLLPGLRLDYFVVSCSFKPFPNPSHLKDLEDLIKHSNGWKELYYVYNYDPRDEPFHSNWFPRIAEWQTVLNNRDGIGSQPLVAIDSPPGHSGEHQSRQRVVVAKRGLGVDYEEKVASPWVKGDIRLQNANAALDVRPRNRKYKWQELRELFVIL
ncbi:hypothetical protein F4779DRAFT_264720 [Xylariaceae sp. FL0662B]|nr:hypothetical protein F4779DRAFT_264720 [Xylariaceae sp. FL0662B]